MFGWFKNTREADRPSDGESAPKQPGEKIVAVVDSGFHYNADPSTNYDLKYFLFETKAGKRYVEAYTTKDSISRELSDDRRNLRIIERHFGNLSCYFEVVVPWLRGHGNMKIPTYHTVDMHATTAKLDGSDKPYPIFDWKSLT